MRSMGASWEDFGGIWVHVGWKWWVLAPFWSDFFTFSLQDGFKMPSRCLQDAIFFHSFFDIVFYRFLSQLGPNLAPKSTPKPTQEPSKIDPKSHLIFDLFFDRFFIDFSSIFDPKITPKSIKNQSQNQPKSPIAKISKIYKKHRTVYDFSYFGHAMLGQKINKNPSKIHHKTALKSTPQLASILEPTWLHFWRGLGAKMGPNRFKNRSSNPSKNWSHFRSLLGSILADFGPQLGAQNRPRPGLLEPRCAQDPPNWS